jgi:peroxiredoxin
MPRLIGWMGDKKRWTLLMSVVFLLGAVWIWFSAVPASATMSGQTPSPRQGFAAPDFTLELMQGGEVTLSDLRGQVIILNLWASWCPPCRAEMPALQRVYEDNRARGLVVLAINTTYQDSLSSAQEFASQYELSFPVPLDRSGTVSRLYQLRALPTTFFIDRQGVIDQVVIGGPMSEATLRAAVENLLDEEH